MIAYRNSSRVHAPLAGYSHLAELNGNSRVLTLSGQVGRTLRGEVADDPLEQLSIALDNILYNLEEAGMSYAHLFKINLYIVGNMDAVKRAGILKAKLGEHRPCMTLVSVAALAAPVYKVEIEAWAAI
jgi:2-iminobutanoate/2-iminopropanoate deaminase